MCSTWLASAFVADITITVTLVWDLVWFYCTFPVNRTELGVDSEEQKEDRTPLHGYYPKDDDQEFVLFIILANLFNHMLTMRMNF